MRTLRDKDNGKEKERDAKNNQLNDLLVKKSVCKNFFVFSFGKKNLFLSFF